MAFNADASPELVMVDEQVVACEVVIDAFDVQYEDDQQDAQEGYVQNHDGPGPSDYHYQYEDDVDPNTVYLFDEDTNQQYQLDPSQHHLQNHEDEDHEIDVQYIEEEVDSPSTSSIPSTSAPGPSTSLMPTLPTTSSMASFTTCERGIPTPPSTYYIRKPGRPLSGRGKPIYSPVSFQTTFSESISRRGKRVIKRTHAPMSTEDMETMLEDAQVLRKLQKEISILQKENDEMKKTYETVHKQFDAVNLVLSEAKVKQREAAEEKRLLQRDVALARSLNVRLHKEVHPYDY